MKPAGLAWGAWIFSGLSLAFDRSASDWSLRLVLLAVVVLLIPLLIGYRRHLLIAWMCAGFLILRAALLYGDAGSSVWTGMAAQTFSGTLAFAGLTIWLLMNLKETDGPAIPCGDRHLSALKYGGGAIVALLTLQILLGTYLRYSGWTVVPLLLHMLGAFLITALVLFVIVCAFTLKGRYRVIRGAAWGMTGLIQLQLLLGISVFVKPAWSVSGVAHQLTATGLFASALAIVLGSYKVSASESSSV